MFFEALETRDLLAIITVTRLDDAVGTGDGVTLREAILAANTNAGVDGSARGESEPAVDLIQFAPGLAGAILLGAGGQLAISETVTIQGNGSTNTIIDAQQQSRIFEISETAGDVRLSRLTIQKGKMTGNSSEGGGILSRSAGTLTIHDSTVANNTTESSGGGIRALGDVVIVGSLITQNSAGDGGGLYSEGAVTITSSTIGKNTAVIGGGIYNRNFMTVLHSTICENTSDFVGGGMYAFTVTLIESTVSGNEATTGNGGGISADRVTVIQSTITDNESMFSGAGIFGPGSLVLRNSILAGNRQTEGNNNPDLQFFGDVSAEVQFSLIGAAQPGSVQGTGNLIGTPASPIDPKLGPLGNNGGPTQTHALLPGSPAINAASNALAVGPGLNGILDDEDDEPLTTDQRGSPRIQPATKKADMGSLEVIVTNLPPTFLVGPSHVVSDESTGQVFAGWATEISAGPGETGQTLKFNLSMPAADQLLFKVLPEVDPATGSLTYKPQPNMKGTATITITLSDNGSNILPDENTSQAETFTIEVYKLHPWHNASGGAFGSFDVNGKDGVTLIDATMVINYLNSAAPAGQGDVPASAFSAPAGVPPFGYVDVAIDGPQANFISILDALRVINYLNTPNGEGEATAAAVARAGTVSGFNDLLALLAVELAARRRRGR